MKIKMYNEEEKAIHFIMMAFANQKRIKEDIPMVFHSVMVGYMLKDYGYDNEVVITGFLHDVIEDTNYTFVDLKKEFGTQIANNVLEISEDQTILDWKTRKEEFLKRMRTWKKEILYVELADKLQNLLSDYSLWQEKGSIGLATLNTTYEMNKWYYVSIQEIFHEKISSEPLLKRYDEIVRIYFGD